jgi:CheY-like chemotaxis protein
LKRVDRDYAFPRPGGIRVAVIWPPGPGEGVMVYRVLIVEDNPDGADSLGVFLRMSGFDVRVAYSGQEGVEAALADPPDAVLCDINMPEVDGFAVARRLRTELPDPPLLVAVTARREQELLRPAAEAGFDHYFIKPADPVEIGGLLSEYADGGPVAGRIV